MYEYQNGSLNDKKILKIPKGYSGAINPGRTDNSMAKGKKTNNDLQNTTQKTKDRATGIPLKRG